jgi:hypothetical protein
LRRLFPFAGLLAAGLILASQTSRLQALGTLGLHDYVAYWSAGRLNAQGTNPYAPEALLAVQRAVGWDEDWPNIMYYPPWTFPFIMPFGLLPYGISRLLWLLANIAISLFSADWAWRYFDGPPARRWVAWLLAFIFVPTLIVLKMGQIGPLLLLGVVGFLQMEKQGKDWLAGVFLVAVAIKPQLVYLFGLAVVFWAIDQGRWRVLAGGVAAGVVALAVALAANPQVLWQYGYALQNPPSGNITPTLGALLRMAIDEKQAWLQFVPTAIWLLLFPLYWRKVRTHWNWGEQAPLLLLASFFTTSYGAWVFDLVILLVPILQTAVWAIRSPTLQLARWAVAGFLVIDGLALLMNLRGATYPRFIWMTPAILASYLVARWLRNGAFRTQAASQGAEAS